MVTESTRAATDLDWTSPATKELLDPVRARNVLLVLAGIALMVTYVETMVVPAQYRFVRFFDNAPISTVSWILAAYLVVGTVVTPIFGKLGDIYGKKRMLVAVLAVYAIAVSFAGFTPSIGAAIGWDRSQQLDLFIGVRAVQGLGMAMFPLAFAMIRDEFPPARVGPAQGIVSAMFAAGAATGLVGGAWVTQNFGWQDTYHTVIPVAILMLLLTILVLRESRHRLNQPLDVPGALFLGMALLFTLLGLTQGPTWGWTNWNGFDLGGVPLSTPLFFVLALIFAAAFAFWEPRTETPIVNFARLRQRNILASNIGGVFVGAAMFLMFVGNTYLVQLPGVGLGQTVLTSGLISLPSVLVMMVVGPLVGRWVTTFGPKPIMILGFLSIALGGFLLIFFNRTILELIFVPIPVLAGAVAVLISMSNVVLLSSEMKEAGIQIGMNQTFRNLGSSLGPVLAGTVLASFTAVFEISVAPHVSVPVTLPDLRAFQFVYVITALLGLVGAGLSLGLRNFRFTREGVRVDEAAARPAVAAPGASAMTADAKAH
jgi:MFS family permease